MDTEFLTVQNVGNMNRCHRNHDDSNRRAHGRVALAALIAFFTQSNECYAFNLQQWVRTSRAAHNALREGRSDESKRLFAQALEEAETKGPESAFHAVSLRNLALVCRERKEWDKAEALHRRDLEIISRLNPESSEVVESLYYLGEIAAMGDHISEAETLYLRALKIADAPGALEAIPDRTIVLLSLVKLYYRQGRYKDALPCLRRAVTSINSMPNGSRYRYRLARSINDLSPLLEVPGVLGTTGSVKASAVNLRSAADASLRAELTQLGTKAMVRVVEDPEEAKLAIEVLNILLRVDPAHRLRYANKLIPLLEKEDGPASDTLFGALLTRGNWLCEASQLDKAKADYLRAMAIHPSNPLPRYLLGNLYCFIGKLEEGLKQYNAAINLWNGNPEYYLWRAHAHRRLRQWNEALADYNRTMALGSKDPSAICGRGQVYCALGFIDKGIADYRAALKVNPKDPAALSALGGILGVKGLYDEALTYCNRYLELVVDEPAAYVQRGFIYLQKGDKVRARADCKRAGTLHPTGEWVQRYNELQQKCEG